MSDDQKVYLTAYGQVQAFVKNGVKQPPVRVGNSNNQNVYNVTIKTDKFDGQGKAIYVELAYWSGDWGDVPANITEGSFIWCEGQYKAEGDQGQFHKITPQRSVCVPGMVRLPREVQNAAPAQLGGGGFPGAAQQVQQSAQAGVAQPTAEQIAAYMASQAAAAGQVAASPVQHQAAPNPFSGPTGF